MQTTHRPKGLLTNATWNAGYVVSTMAISFVITPLLLRHLGQSAYGILVLIWSVAGILGTMDLGLTEATLRYVSRYASQGDMTSVNRVFGAVLSLFVVVCGLLLVGMFVGAPAVAKWLNTPADDIGLVTWLLRLSALTISLSVFISVFLAIPRSLQRFDIASKISMSSTVVRSIGYIALALVGLDIAAIVAWDLLMSIAVFYLVLLVAKRLLPSLRAAPSFSFVGLREVVGYSVFSFLTFFIHKWHRESGKLVLARFLGPGPVVYLATPDNVAQRFHEVIASGVESALPRFSTEERRAEAERLFWNMTWAGLAVSIVVFVPFVILVPDFLRLWIDAEFAEHSGPIGQLLGLYLISQGGFTVPAAYFRGSGKPWIVTGVILGSLLITVATGLLLIPELGPIGAGYAYLAGSASPFLGMTLGSAYAFGIAGLPRLLRAIAVPLVAGATAGGLGLHAVTYFGADTWVQLLVSGTLLTTMSAVLVFGADYLAGGEGSASMQLLRKIGKRLPQRLLQRRSN